MSEEMILNLGAEAIKVTIFLAGPMLIAAMLIGILVSIFQAITQINESTLTFIPKMVAVTLVLALMAPWMIKTLQEYAGGLFGHVTEYIR